MASNVFFMFFEEISFHNCLLKNRIENEIEILESVNSDFCEEKQNLSLKHGDLCITVSYLQDFIENVLFLIFNFNFVINKIVQFRCNK